MGERSPIRPVLEKDLEGPTWIRKSAPELGTGVAEDPTVGGGEKGEEGKARIQARIRRTKQARKRDTTCAIPRGIVHGWP